MDCRQVARLIDSYAAGELPADKAAEVAAHVEACAACAGLLEECRLAGLMLRSSDPGAPVADARFFRVLSRRLDEVSDRFAGVYRPAVRWHIIAPVSAVAAAVLMAAYYFLPPQAPSRRIIILPTIDARQAAPQVVQARPRDGYLPYNPSSPQLAFRNVSSPSIDATDRLPGMLDARARFPRFDFPKQPWPVMGTNPPASQSVTKVDYEKLQNEVSQLEARMDALERKTKGAE